MNLGRMLAFAGAGLLADQLLFPLTGGQGMGMGLLAGLMMPDARDMDQAGRRGSGLGIFEGLFDNTEGGPRDPRARSSRSWGPIAQIATMVLGATLFSGGGFGRPLLAPWLMGMSPYNAGGLLPFAWQSGMIPNWGMLAGFVY